MNEKTVRANHCPACGADITEELQRMFWETKQQVWPAKCPRCGAALSVETETHTEFWVKGSSNGQQ
jgi:ribosomal protein S27AE